MDNANISTNLDMMYSVYNTTVVVFLNTLECGIRSMYTAGGNDINHPMC